jgi:DNA-binding response OmpR family regulator
MMRMATPRLLFIEDDQSLREAVMVTLKRAGFEVRAETDGSQLAEAVAAFHPDLAILDVRLPGGEDGFTLAGRLRTMAEIPIVFVTAADALDERLRGFDVGADDYIVKPFGMRELIARVRAVSRRAAAPALSPPAAQDIGSLQIDRRTRRVTVEGNDVALAPKEFDLLALLAEDPGAVVSRREIMDEVWDPHWYGTTKTLDVHMASLRKKLGDPTLIETVRSVGFRLHVP